MPNPAYPHEHSLAAAIRELRDELKEFIGTRLAMLRSEMKTKLETWKAALPMAVVGAVLLATAFLLLTIALVALIMVAFYGSPYAWFFGFLIVGVAYAIFGGGAAFMAVRNFKEASLKPTRTLRVLEQDKIWLQSEARTQL